MTLQQMEYIVAVFQQRHFAKAAEQCGVTQPTLSAMIQKLETELGVKIFERSPQQVQPTAIGKLIVAQAWKVLSRAKKIKDIVAEEQHALNGTFKIGILPTIAPYLLPRFFPGLTRTCPELDLRVIEMKTDEIKKALSRGEIDAAILVQLDGMEEFDTTHLFYEQFIAYVSENDPLFHHDNIKVADLNNEFLWLLDEGHCFADQLVKFCGLKSARKSKSTYSLGSIETFMRMVESGWGVTFIPELALGQLSERQRRLTRPFAIPIPTRQVVLMTTKTFIRHSIRDVIAKAIKKSIPENMLQLNNTEQRI